MKVSNDLIDMVTEACMNISGQTKHSYEYCVNTFLAAYLHFDGTLAKAKKGRSHEEWKAAYERFHAAHFKDSPYAMTVEARLEKAKADRLREINAALLEALEAQGNVRDDGNWHSKGCHPFRDNPYPCSSWCIQAREAIEEARK